MSQLKKDYINPQRGFTQVVAVSYGGLKTFHISGQVGWQEGADAPAEDLAAQARIAFGNFDKQLAAAGIERDDVVKLTVFIKEIDPSKVATVGKAQSEVFRTEKFPAATWVGVTGLVDPRMLVEIEGIAVVVDED